MDALQELTVFLKTIPEIETKSCVIIENMHLVTVMEIVEKENRGAIVLVVTTSQELDVFLGARDKNVMIITQPLYLQCSEKINEKIQAYVRV